MIIEDFRDMESSVDDLQFALSLVLDGMQVGGVASNVLQMCLSDTTKEYYPRLYVEDLRNALGKSVLADKHPKEVIRLTQGVLQDVTKQSDYGNAMGLIRLVCQCNVVPVVSGGKVTYHRLRDLTAAHREVELYENLMLFMFKTQSNYLIYHYCNSNMFRVAFDKMMHAKYSTFRGTKNDLSPSIVDEEIKLFSSWIYKYSTNYSYLPSTRTPDKYLFHAFESYFSNNAAKEFFGILNARGQEDPITESGASIMSFIGVDSETDVEEFCFPVVARKICKASSIYIHKGKTKYYYDIFSRYLDEQCTIKTERLKKHIVGVEIIPVMDNLSVDGNLDTIQKKNSVRDAFCGVFDRILMSLDPADLYTMYQEAAAASESKGSKDGVRIFSTSGVNNIEKFQDMVQGYLALRDLIAYTTKHGISLGSINPAIFRDIVLTYRFQTLEEYINYYDEVASLPNATQYTVPEGSIPNESVVVTLSLLKNEEGISERVKSILSELCFSDIEKVIFPKKSIQNTILRSIEWLQVFCKIIYDECVSVLEFDFDKCIEKLALLGVKDDIRFGSSSWFIKMSPAKKSWVMNLYLGSCSSLIFIRMGLLGGHPVCKGNVFAYRDDSDLVWMKDVPEGSRFYNRRDMIPVLVEKRVHELYTRLFGQSSEGISSVECIRTLLMTGNISMVFLDEQRGFLNRMLKEDNLYYACMCVANQRKIAKLFQNGLDFNSLIAHFGSRVKYYSLPGEFDGNVTEINRKRAKGIMYYFQGFTEALGFNKLYRSLISATDEYLPFVGSVKTDSKKEKLLATAADELRSERVVEDLTTRRILDKLANDYSDHLGYVVYADTKRRVSRKPDEYYHVYGFRVSVGVNQCQKERMSRSDIEKIYNIVRG